MFKQPILVNSLIARSYATGILLLLITLSGTSNAQDHMKKTREQSNNGLSFYDEGSIKQIVAGDLEIGYRDVGPPKGTPVILLHGWPYDIHSFDQVVPLLAKRGYRVLVPYLRGYGSTKFLSETAPRNGQQSVFAADIIAFMDALKVKNAIIGGFDWGARTALIMASLWPERCKGIVPVSGYIIIDLVKNQSPLAPQAELGWWYQYYFSTQRGKEGYARNTYEFNKLIWKLASPKWDFSEETYGATAASFGNPDHVAIVIHNYRWRLLLEKGEPKYDQLESRLAARPSINVPAITIGSDFDGAAADGRAYADRFTAKYRHVILQDIGHNVPQEAPEKFADAIIEVDSYTD